jgi:DNA-binding transcriptional LysR family regulator
MNYTVHQLKVFAKVVQLQSITKAAEALFLTQPAVSIQLKNFQDQFEIPLTEVIGRQLYVTDFGRQIVKIVHDILDKLDEINYKTESFKGILSGKISLSIVSTGKYIMPYFLSDFLKLHPGVDLQIDVINRAGVIESLENNEVDFGLVSILPEKLKVEEELLMENKLYLVNSAKDDLNFNNDFNSLPVLFREEGSATRMIMEEFFEDNQITIRKRIVLTSNEAVKQAVIAGLGCSIMPLIGIRNELLNNEIKIIPYPKLPIKSDWRLIWLRDKQFLPVAKAYLSFVREHKKEIIDNIFSGINKYNS